MFIYLTYLLDRYEKGKNYKKIYTYFERDKMLS